MYAGNQRESDSGFARRQYCGRACALALRVQKQRGRPFSAAHRKAISVSLSGIVRPVVYSVTCRNCRQPFMSSVARARLCSARCKKVVQGFSLIHSPAFAGFAKSCAICLSTSDLVGDHDHATSQPRGVLCRNCNIGIGNFYDNPGTLRRAAAYLEGD